MLLGMLITVFIIMCIGIAGNWFYDMLLLRLAPSEYELYTLSIDKHQEEAHPNNKANLYILVRDYMIFIRDGVKSRFYSFLLRVIFPCDSQLLQ